MNTVYGTYSNDVSPMLAEHDSLDRIINIYGKDGFFAISACRDGNTFQENLDAATQLRKALTRSGFQYLPTYVINPSSNGAEDYEMWFIVFNLCKNNDTKPFDEFFNTAIKLSGELRQDVVMVKAPDDCARFYNSEGVNVESNRASFGTFKFEPDGMRFIDRCFVNPIPMTLAEHQLRTSIGEILIFF